MADDAGGHDEGAAWGRRELRVHGAGHAVGVFDAALTGDSVGAAGVDDDGADAFAGALLEDLFTDYYWGGTKGVLGEDGRGGARSFRR